MTNFVDPDQTAPVGAVLSGSTLFAFILISVNNVSKICKRLPTQTTFSDAFFYILRVNVFIYFREALISAEYTTEADSTSLQKTPSGDEHSFNNLHVKTTEENRG